MESEANWTPFNLPSVSDGFVSSVVLVVVAVDD